MIVPPRSIGLKCIYCFLHLWEDPRFFFIWAFPGLFLDFYFFIVYVTIDKFLTMVIGKQERKRTRKSMHHSFPCSLEKAQNPARIDSQQFWTKKAKSVLGFKPGLLGQNVTALTLAPPPSLLDGIPLEKIIFLILIRSFWRQKNRCQPASNLLIKKCCKCSINLFYKTDSLKLNKAVVRWKF